MKKSEWVSLLARLYPRAWRERYGAEFDRLIHDIELRWTDLFDVLRGAAVMQVRKLSSYAKLAGAVALTGVVVALAASFFAPPAYESSSIIRLADGSQSPDSLNLAWQEVTTRWSLLEIIKRPSFDLYSRERNRLTPEEVVAMMRRNLRIERIDGGSGEPMFRISFVYPDRSKVRLVTDELTAEMMNHWIHDRLLLNRFRVVERASSPGAPLQPDRVQFLVWGLGLGVLCGVVSASLRWRAMWTLKVIGCGLAGWMVTSLVVFGVFVDNGLPLGWYTSSAVIELYEVEDHAPRMMTDAQLAAWVNQNKPAMLRDAAEKMRKEFAVRPLNGRSAVSISFTDRNRFKAQQVVTGIVMKLVDQNFKAGLRRYEGMKASGQAALNRGARLYLLEPASLPNRMTPSPQSLAIGAMVLCMLLGGYAFWDGERGGVAAARLFPAVDDGGLPPASLRQAIAQ